MANRKTIAFFNGFYPPHLGGVETFTSNLARVLAKEYDIIIVTTNHAGLKPLETDGGIKIVRLPSSRIFRNRLPLINKKKALECVRREKIDYVICNTRYYSTTFLGLEYAKENGIKPIIIDHSSGYILKPYELICNRKLRHYNAVFFGVSEKTCDWLRSIGFAPTGVVHNSINSAKVFRKERNERVRICYVGRMIKEKGVKKLADSYSQLKERYPVDLLMIGDGPLRKAIEQNDSNITCLGHISHGDVLRQLKDVDIFVLPSLYPEGMPTVLLEAASNKCAIVATNRGGTSELIGQGAGLLLKDDASDLTEKLELLLKNPGYMRQLQESVFKRVNANFSWGQAVRLLKEEFHSIDKTRKGRKA